MESWWSSGGPDWLFVSALLGFGLAVPCAVLAGVAWTIRRPRPTRSLREKLWTAVLTGASLVWSTFVFVSGHPSMTMVNLTLLATALMLACAWVFYRVHVAVVAGAPLPEGIATALGVVRWSTSTAAVVALVVGASSVIASLVLGHPCSTP